MNVPFASSQSGTGSGSSVYQPGYPYHLDMPHHQQQQQQHHHHHHPHQQQQQQYPYSYTHPPSINHPSHPQPGQFAPPLHHRQQQHQQQQLHMPVHHPQQQHHHHNQQQQQPSHQVSHPQAQYYPPTQQHAQVQSAASKRDKRRQGFTTRYSQLTDGFIQDRDRHYRSMLHTLQNTLTSLHSGDNDDLLEEIADIEETRDAELTTLRLWEQYQVERAEKEFEREVKQANDEHASMMEMVKERLVAKLEAQRKKLREDKAMLDIANDHSVFLSSSYGINQPSDKNTAAGTGTTTANGSTSLLAAPGSPGAAGSDRRSLRRARHEMASATYDELSGLSGTEGGGGTGGGGSITRQAKRHQQSRPSSSIAAAVYNGGRTTGVSDADMFSDKDVLEGVLFAKDRDQPVSTRHTTRSYQGVPALKAEEAMEDLALIRGGQKRKR